MSGVSIPAIFRSQNDVAETLVPLPAPDVMTFRGEPFRKVGHFWIERGQLAVAYEPKRDSTKES